MLDQEDKKNGPIDYSKFFEEEREKLKTEETSSHIEKKSFLSSLRNFWTSSDKKAKIEIVIFLIIVITILGILIFHFLRGTKIFEPSLYPSNRRVDFLPI